MGMVPIDAASISPEVAANVVRNRRLRSGGQDQWGSMRGTGAAEEPRDDAESTRQDGSSYNSLQLSPREKTGDEPAGGFVPRPPPQRRGTTVGLSAISDVVGAALAKKKEKEQRRLFARVTSSGSAYSEGSVERALTP